MIHKEAVSEKEYRAFEQKGSVEQKFRTAQVVGVQKIKEGLRK